MKLSMTINGLINLTTEIKPSKHAFVVDKNFVRA
jgi:hypothetical protein